MTNRPRFATLVAGAYQHPRDIPPPVRQKLRDAHQAGVSIEELCQLFNLPRDWMEWIVLLPPKEKLQ